MSRNLIYFFSLIVFFLLWGIFGFAAAGPRDEPASQATFPPVDNTPVAPDMTNPAGIPVTGNTQPGLAALITYGLAIFAVLLTILALLNAANKPRTTSVQHKDPPKESPKK
ncbi:MAG TPA: hypothetical protein VK206_00465 [Anaerolineales bacterium]|nr:hypothetical protein [Anaerolineales bacterium]